MVGEFTGGVLEVEDPALFVGTVGVEEEEGSKVQVGQTGVGSGVVASGTLVVEIPVALVVDVEEGGEKDVGWVQVGQFTDGVEEEAVCV